MPAGNQVESAPTLEAAMARIVKVRLGNGQEVDAIEQTFETVREEWNEYALADGGRVRTKTTVQKIFRVVDDQGAPQYDASGDPNIVVRHNTLVSASE